MDYGELSQEDLDAVVTGELTHYALWLEDELNDIITGYFCRTPEIQKDFRRLILFRDGLTFQDKIELVRGMLPMFALTEGQVRDVKSVLKRIEDFKSWRNSMAHGMDVTGATFEGVIRIEVVNRAGRERVIEISPESHAEKLEEVDLILRDTKNIRDKLLGLVNVT